MNTTAATLPARSHKARALLLLLALAAGVASLSLGGYTCGDGSGHTVACPWDDPSQH